MKKIRFATTMMVLLVLFFVAYNTFFGWNKTPANSHEETCDLIFTWGVYAAWAIYLMPVLKIYEKWIERNEKQ